MFSPLAVHMPAPGLRIAEPSSSVNEQLPTDKFALFSREWTAKERHQTREPMYTRMIQDAKTKTPDFSILDSQGGANHDDYNYAPLAHLRLPVRARGDVRSKRERLQRPSQPHCSTICPSDRSGPTGPAQ